MYRTIRYLAVLTVFASLATCDAEFFSATFRLEKLAKTERDMVVAAQRYIQQGGEVPLELKRLCDSMSHPGYSDPERMVHSPVGAYLLLKRFNHIWVPLMDNLDNPSDVLGQVDREHTFPTSADLEGSALALLRLQGVYNLDLPSIAEGTVVLNCDEKEDGTFPGCDEPVNLSRLTSQLPPLPLGVSDVFYVGNLAHKRGHFYDAALWFNLTLDLMTQQRDPSEGDPDLLQVLERLGDSFSGLQKYQQALEFYERGLKLGKNGQSLEFKADVTRTKATMQGSTSGELVRPRGRYEKYEELCRAGVLQRDRPTVASTSLTCTYARPSPHFYIGPLKLEVLREKEPRVALYYDVISDAEADVMRELAFSKFKRSTVVPSPGETEVSDTRVSETGWLPDAESPVVAKLSRRVAHITGLNTTNPSGDHFQVLNYGLGGQYEPHYDHLGESVARSLVPGNRILTFLFYLSRIDAGGATVFTVANIAVPVVKNSAVLFENSNKALKRSEASVHAGCPVLIGSKWVANKWIHEVGNEFQRPCGLTPKE